MARSGLSVNQGEPIRLDLAPAQARISPGLHPVSKSERRSHGTSGRPAVPASLAGAGCRVSSIRIAISTGRRPRWLMQIPKSARRRIASGSVAVPLSPCSRPVPDLRQAAPCGRAKRAPSPCADTGATGCNGSGAPATCARGAGRRPRVSESAFVGVGQGMRDAGNDRPRALGYAEGQFKTCDRTTNCQRLPPRYALRLVPQIRCRRSRCNRFVPQSMHPRGPHCLRDLRRR